MVIFPHIFEWILYGDQPMKKWSQYFLYHEKDNILFSTAHHSSFLFLYQNQMPCIAHLQCNATNHWADELEHCWPWKLMFIRLLNYMNVNWRYKFWYKSLYFLMVEDAVEQATKIASHKKPCMQSLFTKQYGYL